MARAKANVKSKAAKKVNEVSKTPGAQEVESRAIKLAEQIGWLAGTVQNKADTLMDNETLKQQMTMIRDGASKILEQVNRAGSAASESAARAAKAAKAAMPGAAQKIAAAEKTAAAEAKRELSRTPVAAPGKKHRKPPPQVKLGRHAGEMPMGQKAMPNRGRNGQR